MKTARITTACKLHARFRADGSAYADGLRDRPLGARGSGLTHGAATQRRAVRIRMMGGTVPTDVLVAALQLPFVLVPTVNDDNNQHARDENLRIGHFVTGTETIYSLLTTPYAP